MVIDSSALVAIFLKEEEEEIFSEFICESKKAIISAANFFETSMVLSRSNDFQFRDLESYCLDFSIKTISVEPKQIEVAYEAFKKYGKTKHKAKLNFGDCFAYSLAKMTNRPLLYKGNDFVYTDIKSAI